MLIPGLQMSYNNLSAKICTLILIHEDAQVGASSVRLTVRHAAGQK